ncbi:MAG: FHA domain-containing protein, partial [Candidatus Aminicenantes bacterium]|nr:FHA domain-containing protein [Candidatus Aminicenantes bacterium]
MKKTFNLILILSVALSSLLSAQNPPVTNQEIEDFDKKVAKMLPIPRQINVSVDVVGLEIGNNPAAEDQLSRTASAGTGTYYPVANAADLSKVFSKITTGGGGGGGGRIMSRTSSINWPLLLGIFFLFGSAGLLVGILVSRMRRTAAPSTAVPKAYATLQIIYSDGGTKSVAITDIHSTIGRSENNHVVINDIDVSGIHAEIFISQEGFLLRDSGSTNGTLVNGLR